MANRVNRHRRQGAEAVNDHLENRRPSGGGQFTIDRDINQRHPFQQFGGPGSWNGADPVRDSNLSTPRGDRTTDHLIDPEEVEADCCGDDIDDRIDRSDFVKVNLLDCCAVHCRLGLGDFPKNRACQLTLSRGQLATVKNRLDIGQVPMGMLFRMLNLEMPGSKRAPHDLVKLQSHTRKPQSCDSVADGRGGHARINQSGDSHVSRDACRTIEVSDAHGTHIREKRGTAP